ncbi:hypothetical protein [Shinella sp.]|uniref:hypothetical protein n=1 Tax=Shinella sp. TaxID=1870904 RepID=UPI003D2B8007
MAFDVQAALKRSKAGAGHLLSGLDEIRKQLIIRKEALHRTQNQPVDSKTAAGRLDAWLAHESADEAVKALARRFIARNYREPAPADASAVLFAAVASSVRETLMKHVNLECEVGLSDDAREKIISDHQKEVLRLELAEEATIREAESAGLDILRRPDADVRAVLAAEEEFAKWL